MAASGELKTKPTQHSVKALLENGLQPDILVLRTEHPLSTNLRRKVALFCNVDANAVMESIDVPTIYEVPLKMHEQHLDEVVLDKLNLPAEKAISRPTASAPRLSAIVVTMTASRRRFWRPNAPGSTS